MVWPFKKKKFIDLTEKGSVVSNDSNLTGSSASTGNSEYKDLSQGSALGFLGTMAGSAAGSSSTNSSTSTPIVSSTSDPLSLRHLKVKFEDVEYKMDNLRARVDKILDRLDLAEKRLDRVDRR